MEVLVICFKILPLPSSETLRGTMGKLPHSCGSVCHDHNSVSLSHRLSALSVQYYIQNV